MLVVFDVFFYNSTAIIGYKNKFKKNNVHIFHWKLGLVLFTSELFFPYGVVVSSVVMTAFATISQGKRYLQHTTKKNPLISSMKSCKPAVKSYNKIDLTKCLCECKVFSSSKTQVTYLLLDLFFYTNPFSTSYCLKGKKKKPQPNRTAIVQMVVEKMESRTNSYTMI